MGVKHAAGTLAKTKADRQQGLWVCTPAWRCDSPPPSSWCPGCRGQMLPAGAEVPIEGPCQAMDFELEMVRGNEGCDSSFNHEQANTLQT